MATTYRQNIERYEEIEIGDTVTYHVDQIVRIREKFRRFDPVPAGPPYGEHVEEKEILAKPGGYHPTGKVIEATEDGAWMIRHAGAKKSDPLMRVDRENFWALRKAPGKGRTEKRFAPDDAVVACQICGGSWIGNSGKTPHHGYRRPGWGLQTNSCPGAMELPYAIIKGFGQATPDPLGHIKAIGRNILPDVINDYEEEIERNLQKLNMLKNGGPDQFPGINVGKPYGFGEKADDPKRSPLLRGTKGHNYTNDYEARLTYEIKQVEVEINSLKIGLRTMQVRFDEWKPGGDGILTADAVR